MKNFKKSLIRVSPQLHKLWVEAARREEVSRAAFLRLSIRERARRVLSEEKCELLDDRRLATEEGA